MFLKCFQIICSGNNLWDEVLITAVSHAPALVVCTDAIILAQ